MKSRFGFLLIALIVGGLAPAVSCGGDSVPFTPAKAGATITLPRDHGAHPEYETEWWYYTGHLVPAGDDIFTSDRRYGFQLTFFRRATRDKSGVVSQLFLAHAAFTDVAGKRFVADSRISPQELGVARASPSRLDVRHLDWSAEQIGAEHHLRMSLPALAPAIEFRFIGAEPPALLHGEGGFSRKGSCSTCASMYYSLPRIELRGHLVEGDTAIPVQGLAWMDHEFMTNALEPHQVGWDWLSLMQRDGTDLMVFRIRTKDGSPPFLAATVRRGGVTRTFYGNAVTLEPLGSPWRSPATGGEYPLGFRVSIPELAIATEVHSLLSDQEVAGKGESGIAYYEGAVRSSDRSTIGYLEMTGYAAPLGERL